MTDFKFYYNNSITSLEFELLELQNCRTVKIVELSYYNHIIIIIVIIIIIIIITNVHISVLSVNTTTQENILL